MPKDFSPLSMPVNACREFDYLKNSFEFSFLLDKSQLQILFKCLKTDRVFYLLFLPLEFFLMLCSSYEPKALDRQLASYTCVSSENFLTSLRVSMLAVSFKNFPSLTLFSFFNSWLWPESFKPLV